MSNDIVFYASPDVFSPTPSQIVASINSQLGGADWQSSGAATWAELTGNPSDNSDLADYVATSDHVHAISDISGLQTALNAKVDSLDTLVSSAANNQITAALKDWVGTQSAYDALASKPDNTMFVIVPAAT